MSNSIVDSIMEKLEKQYSDVFIINNDKDLSQRLNDTINQFYKNTFNGYNGKFDANNLQINNNAEIIDGSIKLGKAGAVFGPYFTFLPGDYTVEFSIDYNKENKFKFDVFSAEKNKIFLTEEICKSDYHALEFAFSINEEVKDIEFRVFNLSDEIIWVKNIIVTAKEQNDLNNALNNFVYGNQHAESTNKRNRNYENPISNILSRDITDALDHAPCYLPEKTRFRFAKRVIKRVIKIYTRFQVDFNIELVSILGKFKTYIDDVHNDNLNLQQLVNECKEENARISKQLEEIQKLYATVVDKNDKALKNNEQQIQSLQSEIMVTKNDINDIWKFDKECNQNFDSIWKTYQQLRKEVFFEIDLKTGNLIKKNQKDLEIEPVIKQAANKKMEISNGTIRLNLGSGPYDVDGYLSVDARDLPNVDIVADVANLPFADNSIDEIFSAHLIEHFTTETLQKVLMPYWKEKLKNGGKLRIIFPDFEAMLEDYNKNEISFENLSLVLMGGQDYGLDYHYSVFSVDKVKDILEKSGFHDIEIVERGRKNDICRESEIIAIK